IAWGQVFATIKLNQKWSVLPEYQWRRADGVKRWQQSLARIGLQYNINEQLAGAVGYGWIETFSYGDYPIAANGTFPEHRIHEQLQLKNSFGKLALSQRLRIEQRWVGRRTPSEEREIEGWTFSHRFRYLLRLQHPIVQSKAFNLYTVAADEIFVSAGKNVGANTFDQNRLMVTVGSKLSKSVSVEAGYIKQTVFQGRRINNNIIVQNNDGFTLALLLSL
ncbi:MAG TPA: DUF2490 domain-containing protein, partial [Flavisolibacter sp.]|nr:DUF2490 domain-containing protein [Flavisolibacter sp.]